MGTPWWERQHKKLREPHDSLGLRLQVKNSPWIYLDLPSLVCFQSSSTKWFKIAWETARRCDNLKEPDRLSGEREKREKGSRSISKEGPLAFSSSLTRKIVGNGAGTSINWWSFYWHIYDVSVRCRTALLIGAGGTGGTDGTGDPKIPETRISMQILGQLHHARPSRNLLHANSRNLSLRARIQKFRMAKVNRNWGKGGVNSISQGNSVAQVLWMLMACIPANSKPVSSHLELAEVVQNLATGGENAISLSHCIVQVVRMTRAYI